jgi:hypothetical protein
MPVLVGVADQTDVSPRDSVVEELLLGRCHHPAPVNGHDWLRLLRHPSNDTGSVVTSNQGIVIDEAVRQPHFVDSIDLGLN